jgi:hypothetical protein
MWTAASAVQASANPGAPFEEFAWKTKHPLIRD